MAKYKTLTPIRLGGKRIGAGAIIELSNDQLKKFKNSKGLISEVKTAKGETNETGK